MDFAANREQPYNAGGLSISKIILVLSRFETFIATVLASLIVEQICISVQNWRPAELELPFLTLSGSRAEVAETARDKTVEV